jgi:hypothetical protein
VRYVAVCLALGHRFAEALLRWKERNDPARRR